MRDPDGLEQAGRAAGEDGDGARAVVEQPGLGEDVAHALDVGAQRLQLVVVEVAELLDPVAGVGDDRRDEAGAGGGSGELGGVEVDVDAQHPPVGGAQVGELAEALGGSGHEVDLPARGHPFTRNAPRMNGWTRQK